MNKVDIVLLDCRGLDPTDSRFEQYISPLRREKLCRFSNEDAKRLSLGAELALCGALSLRCLPHTPPVYNYDQSGRPMLPVGSFISLSHSGYCAACACAEIPVGVDIEAPRAVRPDIIRRVMSKEEAEHSQGEISAEQLLSLWVVKESALKLTGEGLRRSMTTLTARDGIILCEGEAFARYQFIREGDILLGCSCREEFSLEVTSYTPETILNIL